MSKELCEMTSLFTEHTAWFSSSVLPKTRGLWLALGGTECSLEKAEFVFSTDVNCPDTVSIFMDTPYRKAGLAVIDPAYIKACIVAEDLRDVAVGDYILYPESLQQFIKGQRLKNMHPSKPKQRNKQQTETKRKADIEKNKSISPQHRESEEDGVHISDMELISGDLDDFIPGKNKCLVYHL